MEQLWVFGTSEVEKLHDAAADERLVSIKAKRFRHYVDGNWAEALVTCNSIIENYGGTSEDYVIRANTFLKMNECKRAAEDCAIALEKNPSNSSAYCTRGLAYRSVGKLDDAEADYNNALLLNPNDVVIYSNRSAIYRQRSQWRKVIDDCSEIIRRKEDASAYTMRGAAYGKLRELETAASDCERAVYLAPKDSTNHANLALVYSMMAKWDKAISECNLAIDYGRLSASVLTPRAIAYGKLRRFELALADLNLAISLEPAHLNAWSNRVVIFTKLGKWHEVISDCTEIISIDAGNLQAYNSRGVAYHMVGDNLSAEKDLTLVVERENNNMISKGRALGARAAVFCAVKKWKLAVEDCQRARVLDPQGSERYKHIQHTARVAAERAEKDAEDRAESVMEELLKEEANEKLRLLEQKLKKKRKAQKKKNKNKRELSNNDHNDYSSLEVYRTHSSDLEPITDDRDVEIDNDLGIVEYEGNINQNVDHFENSGIDIERGGSIYKIGSAEHLKDLNNVDNVEVREKSNQICDDHCDDGVKEIISEMAALNLPYYIMKNREDNTYCTDNVNEYKSIDYNQPITHSNVVNSKESSELSVQDDRSNLSIVDMLLFFLPTFPMFHGNKSSSSSAKSGQTPLDNSSLNSNHYSALDPSENPSVSSHLIESSVLSDSSCTFRGPIHVTNLAIEESSNAYTYSDNRKGDILIPPDVSFSTQSSLHASKKHDVTTPKKSDLISIGKLAFSLAHVIGRGSFGTVVYAGAHVEFGRAAIKAISKEGKSRINMIRMIDS